MIKLQIKNRFTGSIIFEYEKENNTISETVKQFIKEELEKGKSFANLSSADLSYANLSYVNLSFANLSYANLSFANLSTADLSYANLSSADLDKKYISISCIGLSKRMTTYCYEDDIIWCGCFKGTLKEFEYKVNKTHANNPQYLKEYLGAINYFKSCTPS